MTSSQLPQSRLGISIATGTAQRLAGADAGEPLDVVALDLHPRAAAVALHPADELAVHPVGADRQPGGEPLDQGHEAPCRGIRRRWKISGALHVTSARIRSRWEKRTSPACAGLVPVGVLERSARSGY